MFAFLADLLDGTASSYTVVVLDETSMGHPRQYQVEPRRLRLMLGVLVSATAMLVSAIFIFTPILDVLPSRNIEDIRKGALANAQTVDRLEDSLEVQQAYVEQLQRLLTMTGTPGEAPPPEATDDAAASEAALDVPPSEDWEDHEQPAIPLESMTATTFLPVNQRVAARSYLSSLRLPVQPPVDGVVTRDFSARLSHYAVDLAVAEGTWVRSIGDGYVVFADWANDGGYTIIVQHADGYISVYKHNKSLRKRVGDRVRDREAIAISGNSGEITTGPHVHFELWHEGLAQDPQQYFLQ